MLTVSLCLRRAEANAPLRARQLRIELEQLGPAYVKVAQAVSTRVDILSPAYLLEIELLQDRVPPFPSSDAIKCIESAIGQSVRKAFTRISSEPVASASLGQVCPCAHVAWQKVRAAFAQMQIGTNLRGCGHHHMPAMQRNCMPVSSTHAAHRQRDSAADLAYMSTGAVDKAHALRRCTGAR